MLDKDRLREIARKLIEAWNSHDIVRILELYDDDFQATNPLFHMLLGQPGGVMRGKCVMRPYWSNMLGQLPHMRFKLLDVYLGVDSFVIRYEGVFEREIVEVFKLNSCGRVVETISYFDSLEMP